MKRFNLSGPQDFMALLVRRKWWIVIPFLALSGAAILMISILPEMYVSSALVMIRPRDVPADFVKDLISGSTEQRVSTIQQIVLSRTNLGRILKEFKTEFVEYQRLNEEQQAEKLRRQITVDFNAAAPVGREALPLTVFRISYRDGNQAFAQKITSRLTDLFIQEDSKAREAQVSGTTQFLQDSLDKIAAKLKESDEKYKLLRASRRNSLPERLTTNLDRLNGFENERRTNQEALDRAITTVADYDRALDSTPEFVAKAPGAGPPADPPNPYIEEYRKVLLQLKDMASRGLTDSHPDVIMVKLRQKKLADDLTPEEVALASIDRKEEKSVTAQAVEPEKENNPVYQRLLGERKAAQTELNIRAHRLKLTESDIATYRKRLDEAPESEQAVLEVARENGDLNKQFQEMNDKLTQARLSESAESSQKGSQFIVVDAPSYPIMPTKPAKSSLVGYALIMSLLAGIALGIVVDLANQKMWTLSDVEHLLGTTVLVEIPEIITETDRFQTLKNMRRTFVSLGVMCVVYAACLYVVYLNQTFVLRQLDPLLQRLY